MLAGHRLQCWISSAWLGRYRSFRPLFDTVEIAIIAVPTQARGETRKRPRRTRTKVRSP